jgi:putative SOS response-associated peptidase YedK
LPSFAKDRKIAWKLSNARGETVDTLPSFRAAFARRRCLVPMNGFYEWRTVGKRKYPFAAALKDDGLMTVAGLWEAWKEPVTGRLIRSCTLITTEPNALMAEVHNRMPVIVKPEDRARWLGEEPAERIDLKALLKPYPATEMKLWPVSPAINRPGLDSPNNLDLWSEPPLLEGA